ncbi:MAG: hypothetical protein WA173_07485, partial [Pseudomonas sp.]|uniref:hypothetical protein n=1 Tax=Pseudomonas sp. TaxID=306 RepID=UPI003BB6C74D
NGRRATAFGLFFSWLDMSIPQVFARLYHVICAGRRPSMLIPPYEHEPSTTPQVTGWSTLA